MGVCALDLVSGYGYGDGDGYGDGSGYGDGYGSGYGSGDGSGDGSGYGDGSGSGSGYWTVFAKDVMPDRPRPEAGESIGFWWSDNDGKPCNGGSSPPVVVGDVQQVDGPLELCSHHALHATVDPTQWTGKRLWLVALHGRVESRGDKMGALKREIVCEVQMGRAG